MSSKLNTESTDLRSCRLATSQPGGRRVRLTRWRCQRPVTGHWQASPRSLKANFTGQRYCVSELPRHPRSWRKVGREPALDSRLNTRPVFGTEVLDLHSIALDEYLKVSSAHCRDVMRT